MGAIPQLALAPLINPYPGIQQNEVTSGGLNDLRTFTSHPNHTL